jgi:hypothetical protein
MKNKWLLTTAAAFVCCCAVARGQSDRPAAPNDQPTGGYIVGNFGISAQINELKGPRAWIKVNPPKLGVWLQNFARGEFWLKEGNGSERKLHLRALQVSRLYPEYQATFDAEGRVTANVHIFTPLSSNAAVNFLPALIIQVELQSQQPWSGSVGYTLTQSRPASNSDDDATPWPMETRTVRTANFVAAFRGPAFLAVSGTSLLDTLSSKSPDPLFVSTPVKLEQDSPKLVSFVVGSFDIDGYYAKDQPTAEKLVTSLIARIKSLKEQLHALEAALPCTGDEKIDRYLRWYASAGILLTKGDKAGDILTMGYRELNQRDSFWTSGIHLVFWKDLERKMILESAAGQLPVGRIPTTILPVIDRGDEIDSNEYFILRVARYYRWHRDDELLRQVWPAVQKAIDYLVSRDTEHLGVPMQGSFWADWKDVPGVQGRKYAPHFALLWLASLRAAAELAAGVNDPLAGARYRVLADHAEFFINRPADQRGMWNGSNYVDLWTDGRRPDYILQDQVVGAYFGVIPPDRLPLIYRALAKSETPWGVRETFPYISNWTEESGGMPGNYHNGGIWPWLNFADATGRYLNGYAGDAERIIRKVGQAGIDADNDDKPGEYLNGDTGSNRGFPIQGWDAALFSTIYFGAFGIDRPSRSKIDIRVQIPKPRDFSTQIVLAPCTGTLTRKQAKLTWSEQHNPCRNQGITVSATDTP